MEELLAELVAMQTITGNTTANNKALDFIAEYLRERGMYIRRYDFHGHGSLVATIKPNAKVTKVILYAHMDVVVGDKSLFTLRRDGDRLFGRGTMDMKFAVAGYLYLVDQLRDQLADFDFAIMITTDEELNSHGNLNSAPYLLEEGYRSEVCIMPDGGNAWDVEMIAKGSWQFDIQATGKGAHGSRPWEGDDASRKLVQALNELYERFADQGPNTDTVNVGKIESDGGYSQIPTRMTAQVTIRLATETSLAENQAFIKYLCDKYKVTITDLSSDPPQSQDMQNPLIRAFMDSITRVTGHKSKGCVSMGKSDAGCFGEIGIPCVLTYPPGAGHHSEYEWVSAEALEQFPEIMHDYLKRNARSPKTNHSLPGAGKTTHTENHQITSVLV